ATEAARGAAPAMYPDQRGRNRRGAAAIARAHPGARGVVAATTAALLRRGRQPSAGIPRARRPAARRDAAASHHAGAATVVVVQYRLPPASGRGHGRARPGLADHASADLAGPTTSTGDPMSARTLSPLDRLLAGCERALEAARPSPATGLAEAELDEAERRHAAGLMRVNHTGEVCAQALYVGQAALARNADNREHLLHAAAEETDHLAWCAERLQQLHSRPSLLNPLWYAGSYAIGAVAAL